MEGGCKGLKSEANAVSAVNYLSFKRPAGGDVTGSKEEPECIKVFEEIPQRLIRFLRPVNYFLTSLWSQSFGSILQHRMMFI